MPTRCDDGDVDEAAVVPWEGVERHEALFGNDDWRTVNTQRLLGDCLTRMGRYDEAEQGVLEAHRVGKTPLGEQHALTVKCVKRLAALYEA